MRHARAADHVDLADYLISPATESARDVEHAFQEALYRRVVTPRAIARVIEREPRRRGAPVVRALIETRASPAPNANAYCSG